MPVNRFATRLSILFLIALLFSCTNAEKNPLERFYFPLQDLKNGRVYEYMPVDGDTSLSEYWYYRSFETDSSLILAGQFIDHTFEVRQFVLEEHIENGMRLIKSMLVLPDSSGVLKQVEVNIRHGAVFPFQVTDSLSMFMYQIDWEDPQMPGRIATLTRNLRSFGVERCTVFGKDRPCIHIGGRELLAVDEEGVLELEYNFHQYL